MFLRPPNATGLSDPESPSPVAFTLHFSGPLTSQRPAPVELAQVVIVVQQDRSPSLDVHHGALGWH